MPFKVFEQIGETQQGIGRNYRRFGKKPGEMFMATGMVATSVVGTKGAAIEEEVALCKKKSLYHFG